MAAQRAHVVRHQTQGDADPADPYYEDFNEELRGITQQAWADVDTMPDGGFSRAACNRHLLGKSKLALLGALRWCA